MLQKLAEALPRIFFSVKYLFFLNTFQFRISVGFVVVVKHFFIEERRISDLHCYVAVFGLLCASQETENVLTSLDYSGLCS